MAYFPTTSIQYADSPSIDAFDRLRISAPFAVFSTKQIYTDQSLFWSEKINGVGASSTFDLNKSQSVLQVGTVSGEYVIRQTKQYTSYQPGRSHLIFITGNFNGSKTNVTKRIGYFDDNNGIFFELAGSTLSVVIRSSTSGSPVDTSVAQSSWNMDMLQGAGPSGITLDITKAQIFTIDFEWLGVGRVRIGFVIDGIIIYCHQFLHSNVASEVFMTTPTLPLRYEIRNTGVAATATTMSEICGTVLSEGGYDPKGLVRSADLGISDKAMSGTLRPLIQLRLNSSFIRGSIQPLSCSFFSSSNDSWHWALILNPTITGGTAASWSSVSDSIAQYDVAATGTVSGGTQIDSGYIPAQTRGLYSLFKSDLGVNADIDGVSDVLVLAAQTTDGTSGNLLGSITWKEDL